MILKRLRRSREPIVCPICRDNREKFQSLGVVLLLITAVGCGIPAPLTIPAMVYAAIRGGRPCESCRQKQNPSRNDAKESSENQ
jgi:predicted small lipoprotein YifL